MICKYILIGQLMKEKGLFFIPNLYLNEKMFAKNADNH